MQAPTETPSSAPLAAWKPSWDLAGLVDNVRLAFAVGWEVADRPERVWWYAGDEFEAAGRARLQKAGFDPPSGPRAP
jgi:hypothetical protein